jgi:UMF1 family MFS transporter
MAPRAPSPLPPSYHYYHQNRVRDVSNASKAESIQAPSLSHSNEADDERSEDENDDDRDDLSSMGPDSGTVRDEMEIPIYEGEDTRFTSKNELRGFYMYGWAAEVGLRVWGRMMVMARLTCLGL